MTTRFSTMARGDISITIGLNLDKRLHSVKPETCASLATVFWRANFWSNEAPNATENLLQTRVPLVMTPASLLVF